jgi:mediator of RNA polymerase II transcription subunit 22
MTSQKLQPQRSDIIQKIREHYKKRIDSACSALLDNFQRILNAAYINDRVSNARENFQIDVYSSSMVEAAESLLCIITELRHSILLNDFKSIKREADNTIAAYSALQQKIMSEIEKMKNDVTNGLMELESARSASRIPPIEENSAQ